MASSPTGDWRWRSSVRRRRASARCWRTNRANSRKWRRSCSRCSTTRPSARTPAAGITGPSTGFTDFDALINGPAPGLHIPRPGRRWERPRSRRTSPSTLRWCTRCRSRCSAWRCRPEAVGRRMLSSVGDVDADRIRRGELDDADWANVSAAMRKLRAAPLLIPVRATRGSSNIVAQIRRATAAGRSAGRDRLPAADRDHPAITARRVSRGHAHAGAARRRTGLSGPGCCRS